MFFQPEESPPAAHYKECRFCSSFTFDLERPWRMCPLFIYSLCGQHALLHVSPVLESLTSQQINNTLLNSFIWASLVTEYDVIHSGNLFISTAHRGTDSRYLYHHTLVPTFFTAVFFSLSGFRNVLLWWVFVTLVYWWIISSVIKKTIKSTVYISENPAGLASAQSLEEMQHWIQV